MSEQYRVIKILQKIITIPKNQVIHILSKKLYSNQFYGIGIFGLNSTSNLLSNPQLNHNSFQPNITLSWVRSENDFAYTPPNPHKLNVSNFSAVTDPILMKLKM